MKYTIGINSAERIEQAAKSGISSVYCGYVDNFAKNKWPEAFHILNRRGEQSNITGKTEFKKVAFKADKYKISIYVTFNGLYTPEQYNWLIKSIDFVSSFKAVKGIIVNDTGLILRLKKNRYKKHIVISTGGAVFNSSSVAFYRQFGIKEIVLDRQLKIDEIRSILKNNKDLKFEIFLTFGNCLFIDGFCSFLHSGENPVNKNNRFYNVGKDLSMCGVIHGIQSAGKYKIIKKSDKNIKVSFEKEKYLRYLTTGCNLCAAEKLKEFSDNIIYKIISRGNFFVDEFSLIKPYLNKISKVSDGKDRKKLFKEIFGYDCNGFGCYANEKII